MSTIDVSFAKERLTTVLTRVAEVVLATKEADIAKALDVSASTLSTWRSRGTMPFEQLVEFARAKRLNILWLIHGEPPMQLGDPEGKQGASTLPTEAGNSARASYGIDLALMRVVIESAMTLFEDENLHLPPAKFAELCMLAYELERSAAQPDPKARVVQLMRLAA